MLFGDWRKNSESAEFPRKWLAKTNLLFRVPKLSKRVLFLKKAIDKEEQIVYDITGLDGTNPYYKRTG